MTTENKVFVVQFVIADHDGATYSVIGVATTPEKADAMVMAHEKLLLKARNEDAQTICALCGFRKECHDPADPTYQHFKKSPPSSLHHKHYPHDGHKFKLPMPITFLRAGEGYETTPMAVDVMPTEVDP